MGRLELLELLRTLDEVTLLELLEINSTDLVEMFPDKIEEKLDILYDKAVEK